MFELMPRNGIACHFAITARSMKPASYLSVIKKRPGPFLRICFSSDRFPEVPRTRRWSFQRGRASNGVHIGIHSSEFTVYLLLFPEHISEPIWRLNICKINRDGGCSLLCVITPTSAYNIDGQARNCSTQR